MYDIQNEANHLKYLKSKIVKDICVMENMLHHKCVVIEFTDGTLINGLDEEYGTNEIHRFIPRTKVILMDVAKKEL